MFTDLNSNDGDGDEELWAFWDSLDDASSNPTASKPEDKGKLTFGKCDSRIITLSQLQPDLQEGHNLSSTFPSESILAGETSNLVQNGASLVVRKQTDGNEVAAFRETMKRLLTKSGLMPKAVQAATKSSRPPNLADRLALAVRLTKGSETVVEKPISTTYWILPTLLKLPYRPIIAEEVDSYGPFKALEKRHKGMRLLKQRPNQELEGGSSSELLASPESLKIALLRFATAIAVDDEVTLKSMKQDLLRFACLNGSWLQRMTCYYMQGLIRRAKGQVFEDHANLNPVKRSDLHLISEMYNSIPHLSFMIDSTNDVIAHATSDSDIIHIVDLTCWANHWVSLFRSFSETSGRPPIIRFTAVGPPPDAPWSMGPCIPATAVQKEVMSLAAELGLQCDFRSVVSKLEDLNPGVLKLEKDETLVVCVFHRLQQLPDRSVLRSDPRTTFLKMVRSWRPRLFLTSHIEVDKNTPFFLQRMKNTLQLFCAIFEALEVMGSPFPRARYIMERNVWAREIENSVACEGLNRIRREECHFQWRKRFLEAGFSEFIIHPHTVEEMRRNAKNCHPNFDVVEEEKALFLKWKGIPTHVLHAWSC